MATIRSREISACLVQAQSQLKALYKDNMDTIIGNCDASLLRRQRRNHLKSWNSLLGKRPSTCITPVSQRAIRNPTDKIFKSWERI